MEEQRQVTATWSIDAGTVASADLPKGVEPTGQTSIAISGDQYYNDLRKALGTVHAQLNNVLTAWKDATGNEAEVVVNRHQTTNEDGEVESSEEDEE